MEVNKAEKIPWGVNEEQYRNKKSEDNSLQLEFVRKIEINEASIDENSGTP